MAGNELKTMAEIVSLMDSLDAKEKDLVIQWFNSKYSNATVNLPTLKGEKAIAGGPGWPPAENESIAEYFGRIGPRTTPEKALVIAGYLQGAGGNQELAGRDINRELTNLGHGVQNITRVIDNLQERNPKLMIQVRKEGSHRQAQKRYKVTTEGFKYLASLNSSAA